MNGKRPVIFSKERESSKTVTKWSRSKDTEVPDSKSHQITKYLDKDDDWEGKSKLYDQDEIGKRLRENYKKMRCQNIINSGKCSYGTKCLYAHSLSEQKVEGMRKVAMDIILKKSDLSDIDISTNKKLYSHLKCMSSMCPKCKEGECTGGYNCKHGACDPGYMICLEDMNKGTCKGGCNKIHLTERGLIPYGVRIINSVAEPSFKSKIKSTVIDDDFFAKMAKQKSEIKKNDSVRKNQVVNDDTLVMINNDQVNMTESMIESNSISAMDVFLSGDAKKENNIQTEEFDPIMSIVNRDYLLEDALAKQDAKNAEQFIGDVDLVSLNMLSIMDSSSDSLSFSPVDDSDDIADILLMNSDTSKLDSSIFKIELN